MRTCICTPGIADAISPETIMAVNPNIALTPSFHIGNRVIDIGVKVNDADIVSLKKGSETAWNR